MSRWTHRLCVGCWEAGPGEDGRLPVTVRGIAPSPCCRCDAMATGDGIYVRNDPATMACRGISGEHAEDE